MTSGAGDTEGSENGRTRVRRLLQLGLLALVGTAAVTAWLTVPLWLEVWIPRSTQRAVRVGALWTAFGAELAGLTLAPPALVLAVAWVVRTPRGRRSRAVAARVALLSASCLFSVAVLEVGAVLGLAYNHRMPPPPPPPEPEEPKWTLDRAPTDLKAATGPTAPLRILVVGESSARGEPYQDWLSVGHILAWQLEKVFPNRRVEVEMRAQSGLSLEQALQKLESLTNRPDAVLVYSGHNEFQGRFSWERTIDYYPREESDQPRQPVPILVLEAFARRSPLARMVRELLDRERIDVPPPPKITRALVDSPVYKAEEYAEVREAFGNQLEAVVRYCKAVGALPLLVMPAGNDAEFDPSRSTLPRPTRRADREAFAREFEAARALEASDPSAAAARYQALLERQPGFALAHYRLARLLRDAGDRDGAARHFVEARDRDGFPMRCPSDFQEAYRKVAAAHPGEVFLADGQAILTALSPDGVIGPEQIHDGQHPTLTGYVALAQSLLDQLAARRAFGWPAGTPAPRIDPAEVAARAGLTPSRWATVCERITSFYLRTAYMGHDQTHRQALARIYDAASRKIKAGTPPEDSGAPGVGVRKGKAPSGPTNAQADPR